MKKIVFISTLFVFCVFEIAAQKLMPLTKRVSVQTELAPADAIIDGEWVAVGTKAEHAICLDSTILFNGKPSFRFELRTEDNTLAGYNEGETKGRAELSYAYVTAEDVKNMTAAQIENAIQAKNIYNHGKGICEQGSTMYYRFSIYVPSTIAYDVNTIFAQWHGVPNRTVIQTPEGRVKQLSDEEFAELLNKMDFKNDTGYDKICQFDVTGKPALDKTGKPAFKLAKEPNGWLVDQGGYPPLAFSFSDGCFNIKANANRRFLNDKTDRTNISTSKAKTGDVRTSKYKTSTLVYKNDLSMFPKNQWVTFYVKIQWNKYGGISERVESEGLIDVVMSYEKKGKTISNHIVDNMNVSVGNNNEEGAYFKFGIYRVGNSTIPVSYNLTNYKEGLTPESIK